MRLNPYVAATVDLGYAGLAAFRPWWVPQKHQRAARLIYSGLSGVLSAASSAESYTGIRSTAAPKAEAVANAAVAVGSAALTYASWPLLTRFNRCADGKMHGWGVKNPPLVSAAVSIGATTLMHAALLALDDKLSDFGDEDADFLTDQKIELPGHIREAVLSLLEDGAAADAPTAQVLREQLAAAEFWTLRDDSAGSEDPLDWSAASISVQVPEEAERVVPSRQTYPVRGRFVAPDGIDLFLSVETIDGRIASIDLTEDYDVYPDIAAQAAEGQSFDCYGGDCNVDSIGDDETSDDDWEAREALFVLRNWPRVGEFEIVTDTGGHTAAH